MTEPSRELLEAVQVTLDWALGQADHTLDYCKITPTDDGGLIVESSIYELGNRERHDGVIAFNPAGEITAWESDGVRGGEEP